MSFRCGNLSYCQTAAVAHQGWVDPKHLDKEELIDLATRKQDWNKMCRETFGPNDYLEEHKKRKRKKEKEMEAKYEETGRKYILVCPY